jgi:hypothetical protein
MIDGQNATQDSIPVLWSATLNGMLGGSTSQAVARIDRGLTQAFAQSPYLQAN